MEEKREYKVRFRRGELAKDVARGLEKELTRMSAEEVLSLTKRTLDALGEIRDNTLYTSLIKYVKSLAVDILAREEKARKAEEY